MSDTDELTILEVLQAALPVFTEEQKAEAKPATIAKEEINGAVLTSIEEAPQKALFAAKMFEDENFKDAFELGDYSQDEKPLLTLTSDEHKACYLLIGKNDDGTEFLGDLVSFEELSKEDQLEERKDNEEEKDLADEATGDEPAVDETEEKEEESKTQEGSVEEKDEAPEPLTMEQMLIFLEGILADLDEALDKPNGLKHLPRRAALKARFLAGYMREVAQKIDPIQEGTKEINQATMRPTHQNGKDTIAIDELDDFLMERVQPKLTAVVERTISKLRGRLD